MKKLGERERTVIFLCFGLALLCAVVVSGCLMTERAMHADLTRRNIPPCGMFLFGTDWMGRDMFARTLSGLSLSVRIGLLSASASAVASLVMGLAANFGRKADAAVTFIIDMMMGVPHMLLLIIVSLACGRGFTGVIAAVALTHWPSLARVVRGEVLQLRSAVYVKAAEKMGVGRFKIIMKHILPHILPQFLAGVILLFPHTILHEAGVTFLGFGLPPERPAIGIIFSESIRYLTTGRWWLAFFPGAALVSVVALFAASGEALRRMAGPSGARE